MFTHPHASDPATPNYFDNPVIVAVKKSFENLEMFDKRGELNATLRLNELFNLLRIHSNQWRLSKSTYKADFYQVSNWPTFMSETEATLDINLYDICMRHKKLLPASEFGKFFIFMCKVKPEVKQKLQDFLFQSMALDKIQLVAEWRVLLENLSKVYGAKNALSIDHQDYLAEIGIARTNKLGEYQVNNKDELKSFIIWLQSNPKIDVSKDDELNYKNNNKGQTKIESTPLNDIYSAEPATCQLSEQIESNPETYFHQTTNLPTSTSFSFAPAIEPIQTPAQQLAASLIQLLSNITMDARLQITNEQCLMHSKQLGLSNLIFSDIGLTFICTYNNSSLFAVNPCVFFDVVEKNLNIDIITLFQKNYPTVYSAANHFILNFLKNNDFNKLKNNLEMMRNNDRFILTFEERVILENALHQLNTQKSSLDFVCGIYNVKDRSRFNLVLDELAALTHQPLFMTKAESISLEKIDEDFETEDEYLTPPSVKRRKIESEEIETPQCSAIINETHKIEMPQVATTEAEQILLLEEPHRENATALALFTLTGHNVPILKNEHPARIYSVKNQQDIEAFLTLPQNKHFKYDDKTNNKNKADLGIVAISALNASTNSDEYCFGVIANQEISVTRKNQYIAQYAGRHYTNRTAVIAQERSDSRYFFGLAFDTNNDCTYAIDPYNDAGDFTKFFNSSVMPNLGLLSATHKKNSSNTNKRAMQFTVARKINIGDQALFDYGRDYYKLLNIKPRFLHPSDNHESDTKKYNDTKNQYLDKLCQFSNEFKAALKLTGDYYLVPQLFKAIFDNDIDQIQLLLKQGHSTETLLYSLNNKNEIASPDVQQHVTPFMFACYLGHPEIIKCLMSHGAELDRCLFNAGYTPLSLLIMGQCKHEDLFDLAQLLMHKMQYPFTEDREERNIVHYANVRNHPKLVDAIIAYADKNEVDLFVCTYDRYEDSPEFAEMDYCLQNNQLDCLVSLFKYYFTSETQFFELKNKHESEDILFDEATLKHTEVTAQMLIQLKQKLHGIYIPEKLNEQIDSWIKIKESSSIEERTKKRSTRATNKCTFFSSTTVVKPSLSKTPVISTNKHTNK